MTGRENRRNMGSQFAIVFDAVVIVILAVMIFSGARRGFVSTVIGMAAVVVAFFCAMTFSAPLSEWTYKSVVEKPVSEAVSDAMDKSMGSVTLSGLSKMEFSKIEISGTPVTEIVPDYAGTDKAVFDLSSVDFTGTGLENADLSKFGFDGTEDLSAMNGKNVEFTMSEINTHGLGRLVTAQVIAVKLQGTPLFSEITDYTSAVGKAIPAIFGGTSEKIRNGEIDALRTLVLNMLNTSASIKDTVVDQMIRPVFTIIAQTLYFAGIFIVVSLVLGLIAAVTKLVNKIPVIGGVNGFLGGCAGLVKGLLTVFIVCILVRLVVSLTGGSVVLFNDAAIDSTYIFRFFYNFDFLNFLS